MKRSTLASWTSKLAVGIGLVSVLSLAACGPAYPRTVSIEYRVTSSNLEATDVIFANETGGNSIESDVALPYSKKISRSVKLHDHAAISVSSEAAGQLEVEILVDDEVVETKTYSGDSIVMGSTVYMFE